MWAVKKYWDSGGRGDSVVKVEVMRSKEMAICLDFNNCYDLWTMNVDILWIIILLWTNSENTENDWTLKA